jgi:hypothetical protein
MTYPETPELNRQVELVKSGKAGLIQEFVDWLLDELHDGTRVGLWRGTDEFERPLWWQPNREQLLADFFGIDRNKIEDERRAILAHLATQNEETK